MAELHLYLIFQSPKRAVTAALYFALFTSCSVAMTTALQAEREDGQRDAVQWPLKKKMMQETQVRIHLPRRHPMISREDGGQGDGGRSAP